MENIKICERFTVGGVLSDVTSVVLSNAAGTAGVIRNDTLAVVVADGTPVVKVSTGVYEYEFMEPAASLVYTIYIEYVYEGITYRTTRTFDATQAVQEGRHLCLLADVKTRLGLSNTDNDTIVESIIDGIDGAFDSYVGRPLLMTDEDVTEYFGADPGWQRLLLRRYPIISITSIKEASDFDFVNATTLVLNTDYRPVNQGLNGIILRIDGRWLSGEDVIQVICRGGYCGAGETPSAGEYALPNELREAAILQVTFMFKRKDDLGLSSISSQGGSISKFANVELLPLVKQTLDKYKKPSI